MTQGNITIAIILIVFFVLLSIVGAVIYAIRHPESFSWVRRTPADDEEAPGGE
jgi:hypothetical protein